MTYPTAVEWLARAFGLVETMRTGTPSGGMHAEMSLDGQRIMIGQPVDAGHVRYASPRATASATMGVFVYLADVDAHYARAVAAGAETEGTPQDQPYGRTYTARDIDGHPWFFTTAAKPP